MKLLSKAVKELKAPIETSNSEEVPEKARLQRVMELLCEALESRTKLLSLGCNSRQAALDYAIKGIGEKGVKRANEEGFQQLAESLASVCTGFAELLKANKGAITKIRGPMEGFISEFAGIELAQRAVYDKLCDSFASEMEVFGCAWVWDTNKEVAL